MLLLSPAPFALLFCKAGEFCYFKHFLSRYFALCLHFESNSLLLFRLEDCSAFNMWYFSVMQRSQCLAPGPLGNALAWMCHVMLNGTFSSFNFQTCFIVIRYALILQLEKLKLDKGFNRNWAIQMDWYNKRIWQHFLIQVCVHHNCCPPAEKIKNLLREPTLYKCLIIVYR